MSTVSIAVLDDSSLAIRSMRSLIQGFGFQFTGFYTFDELMAEIEKGTRFNVYIFDYRLGTIERGPDCIAPLRAKHPDARVIGYSSFEGTNETEFRARGANDFWHKMASSDELFAKITALLS